jgi:dGTPase
MDWAERKADDPWATERLSAVERADAADCRSPFEHDRDRIIHSVAFRRLQGKTQIFAPGEAEFLRTRVTHSIEVAQIGRALAKMAELPGSLVEAACLAHDLGHPPFGHAGETVLDELMHPYGGFEGNAQTFRLLTRLEEKSKAYAGLNLTRATLLSVLKYPYRRSAGAGKFLYEEDADRCEAWLFRGSAHQLLDAAHRDRPPPRTIACQLMDWADDVAYSVHDMEDGLQSGFLLPSMPLERIADWVWYRLQLTAVPDNLTRERVVAILGELKGRLDQPDATIREVTGYYIDRFVSSIRIVPTQRPEGPFDYTLAVPEDIRQECAVFKALTLEFIILDERTTTLAYKGREILSRLFRVLLENADPSAGKQRFELFPRAMRPQLEQQAVGEAGYARTICDYLAGMTDGQALRLYRRLFESTGSSLFEPVQGHC